MPAPIQIPHPPSQAVLDQEYVIDENTRYPGHQIIRYYGLEGKSKPVDIPAWFYDEYIRLSKINLAEQKAIQLGEFVTVVRDRGNNILAMSYMMADLKVVSDLKVSDKASTDNLAVQVLREYINRTDRPMYVCTREGVMLYCKERTNTGTKDFIVRDTYDFMTREQAIESRRIMSETHEALKTPALKVVLAALTQVLDKPLPPSYSNSSYRIVLDYMHHSDIFAHGKTIYDPNTGLVLGSKPIEREHIEQETAYLDICDDLSDLLKGTKRVKSLHALRVKVNGSDTKEYYYKAFGRVHKVTSSLTDQLCSEVKGGIDTGQMLSDFVELWSNRPSTTNSHGDGWVDDRSKDYDEVYLQYRVSINDAVTLFGLYDTPTLADHSGDPEKVDSLNMMRAIKKLNTDKAEYEREIAALKLQQVQEGGRMSAQEHDQKMAALAEKHRLELKELDDKRLRDLEDAEVKRARDKEDYDRRLAEERQKHELTAKREETLHKNTIQTETKRSWGEWAKLVGVVVTTTAVVATAIIKLVPLVTASSIVKGLGSILFGLW